MKKFFLIPLLACSFCAMAFATDVANKTELQDALNAGGDITLTADISLGATKVTMTSGTVVLNLNGHNLTGSIGNYGTDKGVLNVSGGDLTINAIGGDTINNISSNGCAIVTSGNAKVTINGGTFHGGYEGIYAAGGEVVVNDANFTKPGDNNIWLVSESGVKVTVKGGSFKGGWMCFQVDKGTELLIEGGSFSKGDDIFYPGGTITVTGGTFDVNPWKYVSVPYYVGKADALYQVAHIGSNVAVADFVAYPSLAEAVAGASDGAIISLFANDNNSVTVSKNAVIETNGFSATGIVAGAGYTKCVVDESIIITNNPLITFLQGNESTKTLDANVSFAQKVVVNGTKVLTIPSGITVSATYVKDACIVVPNGTKLTILGDGTFAGDKELIRVEEGGELVIGKADQSDCLKMTTSVWEGVNYAVNNYGKTTINNAEVHAASAALNTYGVMNVYGGYYTGEAYYPNHRYCVTADDGSMLTIKNSRVFGIHGALACQGSAGANVGGSARIENCELVATTKPYLTDFAAKNPACHYGIYSASGGIVSVYNTKMRSTKQTYSIHIGNNDAYNTFGLVHVYDSCMVNATSASKRIYVQQRKATDKDVLFPVSVDEKSDWYNAAANGGDGPLPAGYEWKAIVRDTIGGKPKANQVLDSVAYDEGYRWLSVSKAAKQEDASGTTIPWQQNSTWTDTETPSVPDSTTAVMIPEGKTVVVANSESDKTAEANQVNIEGEGASLTVQDNTSLIIKNGINIADGGALEVNAGGVVAIGDGGIVSTNESNIVLTSSEENYSALLLSPKVKENTRPQATYKFKSKARRLGSNNYIWQRLGIPTFDGATTMTWEDGIQTALYDFDYNTNNWNLIYAGNQPVVINPADGKPFQCYLMTIDKNPDADVEYTFTGNLMGNQNAPLSFELGWNFYANSYTAPIDVRAFLNELQTNFGAGISYSIYLYDRNGDGTTHWDSYNNLDFLDDKLKVEIKPMQAFVLQLRSGEAGEKGYINYKDNIYDPFLNIPNPNPAPARVRKSNEYNGAVITVSDGVQTEKLTFIEGAEFSDAFDNGYDADKIDNENNFSLYCKLEDMSLSKLATNDLTDKAIAFDNKNAGEFTLKVTKILGAGAKLYDAVAKQLIELEENTEYKFTAEAINDAARFIINPSDAPSAIDNTEIIVTTSKFMKDGQLYIRRGDNVYTVQGQNVQ